MKYIDTDSYVITDKNLNDWHTVRTRSNAPLPDKETPESCRARVKGVMDEMYKGKVLINV